MPDSLTIARVPRLAKSQDYALLRSEGLRRIERLGHELWTDFNIHDPGIAMMELFCYAITELGYRTGYDIRDLLTRSVNGELVSVGDFHPAQDILPCNPVTFDDLRKLLIDIAGVRNAWITVNRDLEYWLDRDGQRIDTAPSSAAEKMVLNGLFDVSIEFEEFVAEEKRVQSVGLATSGTQSAPLAPAGEGIRFNVEHPITVESVAVYPESTGPVKVRLVDRSGTKLAEIAHTVTASQVGRKTHVSLGFDVAPDQGYRLEARGSVALQRIEAAHMTNPYPYAIDHVVYLVSGFAGGSPNGDYLFFFDWKIHYVVQPPAGLKPSRMTLSVGPEKGAGAHVDADRTGIELVAQRDLTIASLKLAAAAAGELTLRLRPLPGGASQRFDAKVVAGVNVLEPEGFELEGGRRYRLEVLGTEPELWRSTGISYPQAVDNVVEIAGPHPDPSAGGAADVAVLYDLTFEYPSQPHPLETTREDVMAAVRERIHRSRNLCEDVIEVCPLEVEEVAVCSDIAVSPDADVDEVMAEIFYRLELHVSPAVKFYSLDEMRARGKQLDEIFEGPLLDHGFIDDNEFGAIKRRCEIRTSDVVQIIMDVEGVEAIKSISLLSFFQGELLHHEDWLLPVSGEGHIPGFTEDRSKIVFYRNNLPLFADRTRAGKLLKDKKAADLQTKLRGYDTAVPIPVGQDRRVETYFPAQNELPMNFMVGRLRVPKSETPLRKAQSLQLKAFLMLFEQLLANYLSQLAHLPLLFSWQPGDHPTYFTQPVFDFAEYEVVYSLDGVIAAIEEAGETVPSDTSPRKKRIDDGLPVALQHIIETEEVRLDRRDRFLDHLLARFCEDVTEYAALMRSLQGRQGREEIIDDKRTIAVEYPLLSARRGTAYDYRFPADPTNIAGFKRRLCRLLGIDVVDAPTLADGGIRIVQSGSDPDEYRFVMHQDPADPASPVIFESMTCDNSNAIEALLDSVIGHGADQEGYVGDELRWQCADDPDPTVLGTVQAPGSASEVAARFAALRAAEGFHLVEHILLRKRTRNDPTLAVQLDAAGDCECVEVTDPYSFRASIVLPAWPDRFRRTRFRRFVEHTLREQAPAHVFLKICWISHEQMRELEACLTDWRGRLGEIAPGLAVCPREVAPDKPLSGQPLPRPEDAPPPPPQPPPAKLPQTGSLHGPYRDSLAALIDKLENMINVYPLATLYDCEEDDDQHKDDKPPVTLNNTNLGTF